MKITLNTEIVRNQDQEFTTIDNEIVMLNKETGEYNALNQWASRIWEIIGMPIVVKELVDLLLDEFDVEPDICEKQTIQLLEELDSKGLINLVQ